MKTLPVTGKKNYKTNNLNTPNIDSEEGVCSESPDTSAHFLYKEIEKNRKTQRYINFDIRKFVFTGARKTHPFLHIKF